MEKNRKLQFRTINIEPQKFVSLVNPDTQIVGIDGINVLTWNTGIYGSRDNAMPNLLIDLYENGSPVHQNLCNTKANLILGNNLQSEDSTQESVLNPFLKKRNKSGDNPKTVYGKCAKDFSLFNACCIQVIYNRNGKISEVYHIPSQDLRLGTPNKYGQIEYGYISKTWGIVTNSIEQRKKESVKIRMWDPAVWKKYPTQLLYLKDYSYSYYAIPSYMSALNWIMIDREISNFHLNNVKSNFFLAGILSQMKAGMSDEQIDENAEKIESYFAGSKGRKVLLAYPEQMADKPVFDTIMGTEQDKVFDILSQQCFQALITGHNSYPVLGGMDKSNNLGGDADRLNTSLMAFDQLVCEPMKQVILDGFNQIMEVNGLPAVTCTTEPLKLTQAIQQATDLTEAERRAMIFGLPPKDSSSNAVNNPNNMPT
jgi:hypothetical protein